MATGTLERKSEQMGSSEGANRKCFGNLKYLESRRDFWWDPGPQFSVLTSQCISFFHQLQPIKSLLLLPLPIDLLSSHGTGPQERMKQSNKRKIAPQKHRMDVLWEVSLTENFSLCGGGGGKEIAYIFRIWEQLVSWLDGKGLKES